VVGEERVRVGAGRYRRSGQLCGKCAWVPLRPVNHTLAASKWIVGWGVTSISSSYLDVSISFLEQMELQTCSENIS
jgi:hypothetical protein